MALEKLSIAFDADVAEEARRRAGPRGLSRLVNAAVRQYLQALRLREFEDELAAEYGPIPEEITRKAAEIEWPS
ncbi:MAG TPA: hypothetical protein VFW96_04480 [Thermomicrobiales bacterium]|nr:hypothetical protein [Thermomicrobiales bacterium]